MVYNYLAFTIALVAIAKGCHYGKGLSDDDDDGLLDDDDRCNRTDPHDEGVHRGKRSIGGIRPYLSDQFTECMERKSPPGSIPDMRSVVNYALEHSLWYKASDTHFCEGKRDTTSCWQGILDLFVDSELLGPGRECILEYARGRNTGGYRKTRAIFSIHDWKPIATTTANPIRKCPGVADADFGKCLEATFSESGKQSPLAYYDFNSIAIFIRQHTSRCRLELVGKWEDDGIKYRRNCEKPRFMGPNGRTCLPLLLFDITKKESPLRNAIKSCNIKYENATLMPEDPVFDENMEDEDQIYGIQGMYKGSDIVGYCHPASNFTRWFDQYPNGTGDWELLTEIRERYPGAVWCGNPRGIQIRVSRTNKPYTTSSNHLSMSPDKGLGCRDSWQDGKKCENFKVRFCCYEDPNLHNGHHTQNQRHQHQRIDGTVGTCGQNDEWSDWCNIDRDQSDGEFEVYHGLRLPYKCKPVAVQGRLAGTTTPYTKAYNKFETVDPRIGIKCLPKKQPRQIPCPDLEVRFCCQGGRRARKWSGNYFRTWHVIYGSVP